MVIIDPRHPQNYVQLEQQRVATEYKEAPVPHLSTSISRFTFPAKLSLCNEASTVSESHRTGFTANPSIEGGWSKIEPFIPPPSPSKHSARTESIVIDYYQGGRRLVRLTTEALDRSVWRSLRRARRTLGPCTRAQERRRTAMIRPCCTGSTTSWWKWWARINIAHPCRPEQVEGLVSLGPPSRAVKGPPRTILLSTLPPPPPPRFPFVFIPGHSSVPLCSVFMHGGAIEIIGKRF